MTTIVSQKFVRKALSDAGFFKDFPEFRSLQSVIDDRVSKAGCRRCGHGKKPADRRLHGFIATLRSLSEDRLSALKARFNVEKFQFNGFDHTRGTHEVMTL